MVRGGRSNWKHGLLLLAQKGDKKAFTRLIEECQLTLYRVSKGDLKR